MKKIGVIYGSTTGTCESIAHKIAGLLGVVADDISKVTTQQLSSFDILLLGSSTWGYGELQDDWCDGINKLKDTDLNGKQIGFFGCGDANSYPDTFCDAIGLMYREVASSGCTIVGRFPTDGYSYDTSLAEVDGMFIGVALDDINQDNMTDKRISTWVELVESQI